MCTQKMRALSYIGAEKIMFPPKPDGQTYGRTDISIYRVASLLKTMCLCYFLTNFNSCMPLKAAQICLLHPHKCNDQRIC